MYCQDLWKGGNVAGDVSKNYHYDPDFVCTIKDFVIVCCGAMTCAMRTATPGIIKTRHLAMLPISGRQRICQISNAPFEIPQVRNKDATHTWS
jgi:hypothetical protein